MYVVTLGKSEGCEYTLEKVIQLEWLGTPTNSSPL